MILMAPKQRTHSTHRHLTFQTKDLYLLVVFLALRIGIIEIKRTWIRTITSNLSAR